MRDPALPPIPSIRQRWRPMLTQWRRRFHARFTSTTAAMNVYYTTQLAVGLPRVNRGLGGQPAKYDYA